MIIIDLFAQLTKFIYFLKFSVTLPRESLDWVLVLNIVLRYLFSRIIIKTLFYNHHIFSMIFNIIGLLILGIFDIKGIIKKEDLKCYLIYLSFYTL